MRTPFSQADAQMAYLMRTNKVDAVLTQDSDLLAYSCPRVRIFGFLFACITNGVSEISKGLQANRLLSSQCVPLYGFR